MVGGRDMTVVMRSVNDGIALFARELERIDGSHDAWAFHCECGEHGCREWVSLRLDQYSAIRSRLDETLLAPGHTVTQAKLVRELSSELREQARVVRAKSELQLRRSRKPRPA